MLSLVVASLMAGSQASTAPKIVHASIFKNGLAFVTREIDVTRSGDVQIDSLPESTYGTLWFGATQGVHIKQITNGQVSRSSTVSVAGSLEELLRNNIGHEVSLTLKDLPVAVGTLKSAQGDLVVLSQDQGDRVVFRTQILGLSSSSPLATNTDVKSSTKQLRVRVEASRPGKLMYVSLEKGLSWDSAYLVEMKGGKLTLTTRATIVDDLEEISGVDVLLSALPPSMTSEGVLESLLSEGRNIPRMVGGQGLVGESIDFISYDPTDNSLVFKGNESSQAKWAQATGSAGVKREDQFFYRQPDVRLKRGERAQFILSQKEAPYEDLYSLDIVGNSSSNGLLLALPNQIARHSVRFTNRTGQPLTAGVVALISDGQLVGQSSIDYTPVGGDVVYSLGAAPEIQATANDEETTRIHASRTRDRMVYDLVSIRGTLSLQNLSTKRVKIQVSRTFSGDLIDATGNPSTQKRADGSSQNPTTHLEWVLNIDPGKKVQVGYQYRAYVQI